MGRRQEAMGVLLENWSKTGEVGGFEIGFSVAASELLCFLVSN